MQSIKRVRSGRLKTKVKSTSIDYFVKSELLHRDFSLSTFLDSEEEDIVRDDTYLDIDVNLGDKLMSTVVEQIGSNPKWISCVILAPNQLQDYLPDVKIHVL